jgi:hypothetical protein
LSDLPPSVWELIALRHALRALPANMEVLYDNEPPEASPDDYTRKDVLGVFRTLLSAIGAFQNRDRFLLRALDAAQEAAPSYLSAAPTSDFEAVGAARAVLADDPSQKTDAVLTALTAYQHLKSFNGQPDRAVLDAGRNLTLIEPPVSSEVWPHWKQELLKDGEWWDFWIEWYEAFLNGEPPDWELQREIAQIPNEDWEKGAGYIAQRIEDIRRRREREPLDQDALRAHAERLVSQHEVYADAAESTGTLIGEAIARFKHEAQANCLPDGFEPFEQLPGVFRSISHTLRSGRSGSRTSERVAEIQEEINRLHRVIQSLKLELSDAKLRLQEARLNKVEAAKVRSFGEKLQTTLTCISLIGNLGMGSLLFFGVSAEDLRCESLRNALQNLAQDMENVQPSPEADQLPPITDV